MNGIGSDVARETAERIYQNWLGNQQSATILDLVAVGVRVGMTMALDGKKPTTAGVTARQRDLLQFIISYTDKHGYTPSYDEMKEGLGLRSKSGIHRMIRALEEREIIACRHNRARAIEVLSVPVQVSK